MLSSVYALKLLLLITNKRREYTYWDERSKIFNSLNRFLQDDFYSPE